jgi:SAM-dependent methyltransferase
VGTELGSWHSQCYVAEWVGDDVIADLLALPRQISVALVADSGIDVTHVADLASGHGPYLELFLRSFPEAHGTWIDSSEAMEEVAREKLAPFGGRVRFLLGDIERLDELDVAPAEVVVSSRAFHHFSPQSLEHIYRAINDLVVPGGFVFNLDHIGPPGDWEQAYRRIRKQFTGPRKRELKPHRHDYPLAPTDAHAAYAVKAGFATPDTPWRAFYTALIAARKPA